MHFGQKCIFGATSYCWEKMRFGAKKHFVMSTRVRKKLECAVDVNWIFQILHIDVWTPYWCALTKFQVVCLFWGNLLLQSVFENPSIPRQYFNRRNWNSLIFQIPFAPYSYAMRNFELLWFLKTLSCILLEEHGMTLSCILYCLNNMGWPNLNLFIKSHCPPWFNNISTLLFWQSQF